MAIDHSSPRSLPDVKNTTLGSADIMTQILLPAGVPDLRLTIRFRANAGKFSTDSVIITGDGITIGTAAYKTFTADTDYEIAIGNDDDAGVVSAPFLYVGSATGSTVVETMLERS